MGEKHLLRKLSLFGVALDPTDDELKLEFKTIQSREISQRAESASETPTKPSQGHLQDLIDKGVCEAFGEVEIPSWLTPTPTPIGLAARNGGEQPSVHRRGRMP